MRVPSCLTYAIRTHATSRDEKPQIFTCPDPLDSSDPARKDLVFFLPGFAGTTQAVAKVMIEKVSQILDSIGDVHSPRLTSPHHKTRVPKGPFGECSPVTLNESASAILPTP